MKELSPKELEVLMLIAQGYTDVEIARMLGKSHHTVMHQTKVVLGKLGAKTRAHAVYIAIGEGILA